MNGCRTALLFVGILGLALALGWARHGAAQDIVINEFVAINSDGLTDADGDTSDWIEFYLQGASTIDLDGWYLTDDDNLRKWRFPAERLEPGDYLVVFASGKDRRVAGLELHTNFRLSGDGERLALVMPDGQTVAHDFAPEFPRQYPDISYGLTQAATELVVAGDAAQVHVPADGGDGLTWTLPGYNDTAWFAATTGVGYDVGGAAGPPPGAVSNLAPRGTASQSSIGFGGNPTRAIDGNTSGVYGNNSVTHTATGDPAPWWELDLEDDFFLESIMLWNRTDCCVRRLSNFRVTVRNGVDEEIYRGEFFTNGVGFPDSTLEILLPARSVGRFVRVELLGPNADGDLYLSLAEVQAFGADTSNLGLGSLIRTDIESALHGIHSGAYLRLSFQVDNPAAFDALELRMTYDDGFVAYLNGQEVARRNAPASVSWSSAAISARDAGAVFTPETINITAHLGAFVSGTNLLAIHGLNVDKDDDDFLLLPELRAFSDGLLEPHYFREPTPGAANSTDGVLGFVADTSFSVDRGIYDAPFDVILSTETAGAEIRYTTNNTEPTATRGNVYSGPIRISRTTVLRAAAFKAGLEPTNVDTQTYVFLDEVIASGVMDTDITQSPVYGPQMRDALLGLPTMSIVTPSTINGDAEVKGSLELIWPDGSDGFQEDAGIRYYGGAFTNFDKKNFRLYFRGVYGATKLRYPLFAGHDRGITAVEVFDQLELRGGSHDMNQRGFYMSNRFTDDTMLDMGNLNPHGRFVHLYLNGEYWGQYHLRERWNADMLAQYLGGEKEDYEAINGNWNVGGWPDPGVPYDGDGSAWTRIKSLRDDYEAVKPYLDVPHYIDYMLMFMFGNSEDEYRCVGPTDAGSGFKFFLNDADGFTRSAGNRTSMGQPGRENGDGPGSIFSMLLAEGHPDYLTLLADRIHKHFFNDGALTPAKNIARLLERCDRVEQPFIAEAARWGYRTPASWQSAKNDYIDNVLPSRTSVAFGQYRAAGLYPLTEAPVFSQHGGLVSPGFTFSMTAPAGTVYYTVDGTDPRLPGGGVSPAALVAGSANHNVLLPAGAPVRVLVPGDGTLGLSWMQPGFNDTGWTLGQTGVGYERGAGYEGLIGTDVESSMYQVSSSVYLRIVFTAGELSNDRILNLRMKYDDGFVAYLNGVRVASANAPADPQWNSRATASHPDAAAVVYEDFDLSAFRDLVTEGANVLAIHGLNLSASSSDVVILPELTEVDISQSSVRVDEATVVKARALAGEWSALNEALFYFDIPLRVTEVMYHPRDPDLASPYADEDFEFVEVQNVGSSTIPLEGIRLTGGIEYEFTADDGTLSPGAVMIVARNVIAFLNRYPLANINLTGGYAGRLGNSGDRVTLVGPLGEPILDFEYSDSWYPSTDGLGPSLVVVDPTASKDAWSSPDGWRASDEVDGSPGTVETGVSEGGWQIQGDGNQDRRVDISDAVRLLNLLFSAGPALLPCDGGSIQSGGNLFLFDANADGGVDVSDSVYLLNYLFAHGTPPAGGIHCRRVEGCPDACD